VNETKISVELTDLQSAKSARMRKVESRIAITLTLVAMPWTGQDDVRFELGGVRCGLPTIRELRDFVLHQGTYHERSRSNKAPTPGSPTHVFVQKCEHVRLPYAHTEKWKGVSVVGRLPDWRVDLQQMWFTELLQSCVQRPARRERVVVCSMNEEYRHLDVRHGR
jgi:hypothetical protein